MRKFRDSEIKFVCDQEVSLPNECSIIKAEAQKGNKILLYTLQDYSKELVRFKFKILNKDCVTEWELIDSNFQLLNSVKLNNKSYVILYKEI